MRKRTVVLVAVVGSLVLLVMAGIGLAEVGEVSFVLASSAVTFKLLGMEDYQVFLGASILTMREAPFLTSAAPQLADWLCREV